MALIDELFGFITSGSIAGLPTIVVMFIPFILGLIVGFLTKKFLKIAIITAIILVIVSYFGFYNLSLASLKGLVDRYGPMAIQSAVLLIGMLPLGVGFIVGFIIGLFA